MRFPFRLNAAALALLVFTAAPAAAQDQGSALPCGLGMVERPASVQKVAFKTAQAAAGELRITFVGHATFLIETPEGVTLATDYNGNNLPRRTPEIVTMNNFHITHYTNFPDPGIAHVLRGWNDNGGIARHNLKIRDLRVYSVPTNIQDLGRGPTNGNSIFVFDSVGLCLAHLSHLHHDLTPEEVSRLGRIDVLFVPIDGYVTMSHEEVMSVVDLIKPRLVIVMHWDLFGGPGAFLARALANYPIKTQDSNAITVTRETLPKDTEFLLMRQGP